MGRRDGRIRPSEIDWNMEVPFAKQIPAGYYDVSGEIRDTAINKHFTSEQIYTIEHNDRQAHEDKQRKADIRRFNRLTEENLPEAMMQLNRLDKSSRVTTKRAKLSLPAPVVSDAEINAIVWAKGGEVMRSNSNMAIEAEQASRDDSFTSNLLTATPATPGTALRTPLARVVMRVEGDR